MSPWRRARPAAAALPPGGAQEGVPHEYEGAEPLARRGGDDGAWLIDRDGPSFRYVLNYLRARRPVYRNGRLVVRLAFVGHHECVTLSRRGARPPRASLPG